MLLAQDPRLAQRIGALTLLSIAAIAAAFVFLLDRVAIGSPVRFRVLLHHSAGLHDHAPLIVAGQPIGRIASVLPVPHGAPGPLGGDVGVAVTIELARDDAWKVPAGATIFVASRGPLSDRYLEVAPPTGDPGPAITDGAELRGIDPPSVDNVLQHTWANLTTFRLFVEAVRPELAALRSQLTTLRTRLDAITGDLRAAGDPAALAALGDATRGLVAAGTRTYETALGGGPGVAQLVATVRDARDAIAEIRAALDVLEPPARAAVADLARIRGQLAAGDPVERARQVIATLRGALDKLDPLLATLADLGDRIARGEGSVGRLLRDPEFPEDTKELGRYLKRHPWKLLERPPN
ncbi:MAG TPA: MlaD family protein [Kofleriaceae bacterium]